MNTAFAQTSDLQLVAPELAMLRQSKTSCNDRMIDIEVFHSQTDYLPSLYAKFNRLNSTLNQAEIKLRDGTQRLQLDLQSRTEVLRGYLVELAHSSDDDERLEILGDVAKELNATLKTIRAQTGILASSLLSVSETFDRTATLSYIASLNAEQGRLPEEIQQLEVSLAKVEEQRTTVTAAINAIESKGFGAIAQDTLLNAEKVAALGPTPPEAAIIQLALEMLKQSLEKIDASFNFLGLVSLRDDLRKRSNEYSATLRTKRAELGIIDRRIKMILAAHGFDDHLQDYKREFSTVVTSLRTYETRFNRITTVDETGVEAFIADTTALATYLQPIR